MPIIRPEARTMTLVRQNEFQVGRHHPKVIHEATLLSHFSLPRRLSLLRTHTATNGRLFTTHRPLGVPVGGYAVQVGPIAPVVGDTGRIHCGDRFIKLK